MRYLVEALDIYENEGIEDSGLKRIPKKGEQWEIDSERLEVLLGENKYGKVFVKLIEEYKTEETVTPEQEEPETSSEKEKTSTEDTEKIKTKKSSKK